MAMNILYDLEAPEGDEGDEAANEPLDEAQRRIQLQGFLTANYGLLRRRLARHLGCPDMASECLHDAWLRLGDMDVRTAVRNPEAYVYRAACNVAMDRMRSNRSWQFTGDAGAELEHLMDPAPGPDRVAEARRDLAAVEHTMQRLPRRQRAVLIALRIDEMTRQEVAARFTLSLRSVDTALRQALFYCAENTGQDVHAGVSTPRRRALRP
ncbi:RNA polymerase sigma factor [Cupriavidus sp. PET2-C1]